ncbi:hypothetical protein RRF57_002710 [Xylaria bambusicola]|uniref:Uncharacterized protein n=1 Tax=Xylaria bambusicola TaxID=326684 RepID=A0AAN7U7F2_9PEZI
MRCVQFSFSLICYEYDEKGKQKKVASSIFNTMDSPTSTDNVRFYAPRFVTDPVITSEAKPTKSLAMLSF